MLFSCPKWGFNHHPHGFKLMVWSTSLKWFLMLGKKDSEGLLGKLLDQIQLKPKIVPVKSGYIGNPHQMAKQSIMHYLAPMHKCFRKLPACGGAVPAAEYPHTKNTRWEPNFKLNRILGSLHQCYFAILQWICIMCLFGDCLFLAKPALTLRGAGGIRHYLVAQLQNSLGPNKYTLSVCGLLRRIKGHDEHWDFRILGFVKDYELWRKLDTFALLESKTFIFRIPEQPQRHSYFVSVETDLIHGEVYVFGDYPTRCTGSFSPFLTVAMWWPCDGHTRGSPSGQNCSLLEPGNLLDDNYMGVSENSGTPKSSILMGFPW